MKAKQAHSLKRPFKEQTRTSEAFLNVNSPNYFMIHCVPLGVKQYASGWIRQMYIKLSKLK